MIKKDVFIITKPLQYINVLNISSTHTNNQQHLIIVNAFTNSKFFFEEVINNPSKWDNTSYFNKLNEVFTWLIKNKSSIENLYIDSDINNFYNFFKIRKLNISVYEEGVGTYKLKQHKSRTVFGKIILILFELIGFKNKRGGNAFTKNVIVYHPDFYKDYHKETKKNILSFKKPFLQHISESVEMKIFKLNLNICQFHNKVLLLYIAGWDHYQNDIKLINLEKFDCKILKPHPHIKTEFNDNDFDFSISDEIPAEIFISRIIPIVKKIIIVSRFSSSSIYFTNHPKIKIINLKRKNKVNSDIDSYLDCYHKLNKYIANL